MKVIIAYTKKRVASVIGTNVDNIVERLNGKHLDEETKKEVNDFIPGEYSLEEVELVPHKKFTISAEFIRRIKTVTVK